MAVDNHLYNPGCAAMKLNLSRYETLKHKATCIFSSASIFSRSICRHVVSNANSYHIPDSIFTVSSAKGRGKFLHLS